MIAVVPVVGTLAGSEAENPLPGLTAAVSSTASVECRMQAIGERGPHSHAAEWAAAAVAFVAPRSCIITVATVGIIGHPSRVTVLGL